MKLTFFTLILFFTVTAEGQSSVIIEINNPNENLNQTVDSTWNVQNIICHLQTSSNWIEPVTGTNNSNYAMFSGKFKTTFNNFNYEIDSILFETKDACGSCFSVNLYDNNSGNVNLTNTPGYNLGEDTLFYHNPSQNSNPDSLVLETGEGGFRRLIVYYSEELVGLSKEIEENSPIRVINNQLQFHTGNSNKNFDLKIFDINGKEVMNFNSCAISTIDLSQLNSGIYFASIFDQKTKQRTLSKKIAIIH